MRKINLYLATVAGLCLLMMYGCSDKRMAQSAHAHALPCKVAADMKSTDNPEDFAPVEKVDLGPVVFESYRKNSFHPSSFRFLCKGKEVYKKDVSGSVAPNLLPVGFTTLDSSMNGFEQSTSVNAKGSTLFKLTDDGVVQFVVDDFDEDYLFDLGENPRLVKTFECNQGSPLELKKIGRNVHLERAINVQYELGAHGGQSATLLTKWDGTDFVLDTEAMSLPAPSKTDIAKVSDQFRMAFGQMDDRYAPEERECDVASDVLDLFYEGRGRLAKRIYNKTWPRHAHGKRKYWNWIMSVGASSENWDLVKAWNKSVN